VADSGEVVVSTVSAPVVRERMDEICAVFDTVFSAPPRTWEPGASQRHRSQLERMTLEPGFGCALADSTAGLVGFVYGSTLSTGTSWWQGFRDPVPDELVRERPGRTFAVIDLGVLAGWRRHGVGRRLLEVLLAARGEQRATLAVRPEIAEAHAFYAAIGGWQLVGRQDTPGMVSPEFDIYVRDPLSS
jgi:GNAT superfamily N-acetyltransferase